MNSRSAFFRCLTCYGLLVVLGPGAIGCATSSGISKEKTMSSMSYDDLRDPWESVNRKIFRFNEGLDKWVIAPVATGWDWVVPDAVQGGVRHFFGNLSYPVDLGNNLLQGKLPESGVATARFVVNTTLGFLGFFDPATGWGMESQSEDFGQTLAVWGVKPGPYLVLPLLGPSSPRDGFGLAFDQFIILRPIYFASVDYFDYLGSWTWVGIRGVELVNIRSIYLEDVENARETAFDYYVFVRDAYNQRRRNQLLGPQASNASEDDAEPDLYAEPDEDSGLDDDLYIEPGEEGAE